MKVFMYCLFVAVAGFVIGCKEDEKKSNSCADFAKTTLDLQGQNLDVVRLSIRGKWKLSMIGGGCCNQTIPGPPNTYLNFLDDDVFSFLIADTLAAGGKIQWEKAKGWTNVWQIKNMGHVIIGLDSGKLVTSDSSSPWEADSWVWKRNCDSVILLTTAQPQ